MRPKYDLDPIGGSWPIIPSCSLNLRAKNSPAELMARCLVPVVVAESWLSAKERMSNNDDFEKIKAENLL